MDVAGRMTLPANELVKLFDLEFDRPDRQLDFVGFLDGREASRDAVQGSLEDWGLEGLREAMEVRNNFV